MEYFFSDKLRSSPVPFSPAGSSPSPEAGPWFTLDRLIPLPCLFTSAWGKESDTREARLSLFRRLFDASRWGSAPHHIPVLSQHLGGDVLTRQSSSSYARTALNRKIWSSFTKYKPKEDPGGKYYALELPQMWGQKWIFMFVQFSHIKFSLPEPNVGNTLSFIWTHTNVHAQNCTGIYTCTRNNICSDIWVLLFQTLSFQLHICFWCQHA